MKGSNKKFTLDDLQQQIRREKSSGAEQFHRSDFESKLQHRIRSMKLQRSGMWTSVLRPVPLTALFIGLFMAGWLVFAPLRTAPSPGIQAFLANVLEETMKASAPPEQTYLLPEDTVAAGVFHRLEWSIHYALNTVGIHLGERDIPRSIQQVLASSLSGKMKAEAAVKPDRQELADDLNAARKSRDYRFFFIRILQKFQEV